MKNPGEQFTYDYMVAYSLPHQGGIGRTYVGRSTPISTHADVGAMEKLLADSLGSPLVLLSFCLLGDGAR